MQLKYIHVIILLFLNVSLFGQLLHQNSSVKKIIDLDENHYFAQRNNGGWGMCVKSTAFIIPAKYDTIFPLSRVTFNPETYLTKSTPSKYIIARKGNQQILFTLKGKKNLVVNGIMPRLMGTVILARKGKKWGLIHTSGEVLLPITCSEIEWYGDVLALKYGEKWLLFDPQKGQLFNKMQYSKIIEVAKSNIARKKLLLLVQHNDKWGVLNEKIQSVIPIEYDEIKEEATVFICKKGTETISIDK